jgi:hypothetical protein
VGDAGASEDGPHSLPLAHKALHRSAGQDTLRGLGDGAGGRREEAHSFDAPGARYTHRDGKCTFEVPIEEYGLEGDLALVRLARIVHGADIAGDEGVTPQSAGLKAIAEGFSATVPDDQRLLQMEMPVYDALYEWCKRQE